MTLPKTGSLPLTIPTVAHNRTDITVKVVGTLDDLQKVNVLRALTYIAEQDCPYEEEFDGNDLCALHLLAFEGREPAGSLRLRFFADFVKIERVCIDPRKRGGAILAFLMAHAFEIASRKGYRKMIAHMQARLEQMWGHVMECRVIDREAGFQVSGYDYLTLEIPLPEHPDAIKIDADPFLLIRPEGDWDKAGVLDPMQGEVA